MAKVLIETADDTLRLTIKALLERAGHQCVERDGDAAVTDSAERAVALCHTRAVVLLTPVSGVEDAVTAMRQGVYGYALLPLQPGEVELMVSRALGSKAVPESDAPMLPLAEIEMRHIRETLRRCNNNQAKTARVLGIGRNTLWRKLRRGTPADGGED